MNAQIFQVGEYTIEVKQDGKWVTVTALTQDENGKELRSNINNVVGVMFDLLEDIPEEEQDAERFQESEWECASEEEAETIYNSACGLFESAELDGVTRDLVLKSLDEDRENGAWGFPSDGAK